MNVISRIATRDDLPALRSQICPPAASGEDLQQRFDAWRASRDACRRLPAGS
jgi:hypothetical protein